MLMIHYSVIEREQNMCSKASARGFSRFVRSLVWLVLLACWLTPSLHAQETAKFFKQNCSSCHWIGGGRLIGPDLMGVTSRKDREWLVRFIADPKAMLDSEDPYVMKLKAEANGAVMINVPGMTTAIAEALIDLIEAESKLDSSQFAGQAAVIGPFSPADAAKGSELFSGKTGLTNSGPSCVSCHTVNMVGTSLGGRLGPDLTYVFERLQGKNALLAWLSSPPTTTMRSIFKKHSLTSDEVKYLVAFLESTTSSTGYNFDTFLVWMGAILCGLGGSVFGLVVFGGIWGDRFRAVRHPLVNKSKKQR